MEFSWGKFDLGNSELKMWKNGCPPFEVISLQRILSQSKSLPGHGQKVEAGDRIFPAL